MEKSLIKRWNSITPSLEGRTRLGWFAYVLLALPFLIIVLDNNGQDLAKYFSEFTTSILPKSFTSVELIKKLVTKSSNLFLFIFLPILVTTFFELFRKGLNFKNFKDSSLGRLAISEGFKGADVWYWLLNIFQSKFPFLLTFFTLGTSVINSGAEKSILSTFDNLYSSILPFENTFAYSVILIIGILLQELVGYVRHRTIHTVPFFWDLHEFHHSATEMTIFSQWRIAPVESIFLDSLQIPFAVFFGLMISKSVAEGSLAVLIIYVFHSIIGSIYTYYGHSSLKIVYPKPISYIIQSPSCHWLHHSANPDHFNCNFGGTYTLWDKLFGTFLDESHLKDITGFGVENTEYNKHHPLYSYLILPVKRIAKRVKNIF